MRLKIILLLLAVWLTPFQIVAAHEAAPAAAPATPAAPSVASYQLFLPLVQKGGASSGGAPLNVTPSLEPGRAVTASLPLAGGVLTASGADGSRYTLSIPANALLVTTTITMTPISAVAGLPAGGGPVYGVQLAPEGLQLFQAASLVITPSTTIPLVRQFGFAYYGNGADAHHTPLDPDTSHIRLTLTHFSGWSVGDFGDAVRAGWTAFTAGLAEARLRAQAAEVIDRARQGQLAPGQMEAELLPIFQSFYEQAVMPRLAEAETNDQALPAATQTMLGWERQLELLGLADHFTAQIAAAQAAWRKGIKNAYDKAFDRCVDNHDLSQVSKILELTRMTQLLGMDDLTSDSAQRLDKCERFEISFDSTIHYDAPAASWTARVQSQVVLVFAQLLQPDDPIGTAPLTYTSFAMQDKTGQCAYAAATSSGVFAIRAFNLDVNHTPIGQQPIFLWYQDTTAPAETITLTCQGTGPIQYTVNNWDLGFLLLHNGVDDCCYVPKSWTEGNDDVIASKTYTGSFAGYSETTKVIIKHAPVR